MSHNLRLREDTMKPEQHIVDSFSLLRGQGVAWLALLIQSTLVADANRTAIVRSRMGTHFEQEPMLRHRSVLSDIEMIPDVIETPLLMVSSELFHRIVLVATGGGAMQH